MVRNQFDYVCKRALKAEKIDYLRNMNYRRKHEIMFSELSETELNKLTMVDEYSIDSRWFQVRGYDIEVKDSLIVEALETLTERKREVVLMSYFLEMSDAEIGRQMNLVRSTICAHRKRSLNLMKEVLEERKSDEK